MNEHVKDSDCVIDSETGTCIECGVEHGEPMTARQWKRAIRLYLRYKTETREYSELAAAACLDICGLNRRIWQILHDRKYR